MPNITSTSDGYGGREAVSGAPMAWMLGGTIYFGIAQGVSSTQIVNSDFVGDPNIGDPLEMASPFSTTDFDATAWAGGATAYTAATTEYGRRLALASIFDNLSEGMFVWNY